MERSTTEWAAEIRAAYKRRGWSSKQISVRAEYFSMGSAIRVQIKDGAISLPVVEQIANQAEDISRDQFGEILSGGNTYVSVSLTAAAEAVKVARYIGDVEAALRALPAEPTNTLEPIGASGALVGRHNGHFTVWLDHGCIGEAWTDTEIALRVALAIEKQAAAVQP